MYHTRRCFACSVRLFSQFFPLSFLSQFFSCDMVHRLCLLASLSMSRRLSCWCRQQYKCVYADTECGTEERAYGGTRRKFSRASAPLYWSVCYLPTRISVPVPVGIFVLLPSTIFVRLHARIFLRNCTDAESRGTRWTELGSCTVRLWVTSKCSRSVSYLARYPCRVLRQLSPRLCARSPASTDVGSGATRVVRTPFWTPCAW